MATSEVQKKARFPVFKERFYKLRGEISQAEFADKIGIARATVGLYENGERIPDALVLKQIAEKCGVSADWLLGLTSDPKGKADTMAVEKRLGLSAPAQDELEFLNTIDIGKTSCIEILNDFLVSDELHDISRAILSWVGSKRLEVIHEGLRKVSPSATEINTPLLNRWLREWVNNHPDREKIISEHNYDDYYGNEEYPLDKTLTEEEAWQVIAMEAIDKARNERTLQKAYRFEAIERFSDFVDTFVNSMDSLFDEYDDDDEE
ncbi:MAG: helix-turn-helix domain-containing protein [Defluviitaleaceae bacterium]|nr:helix-turn-helix domain-containing protein [Defluviitaleaceae bacterium]